MTKEEIRKALRPEPFVPLRIHRSNGKRYDVPVQDAARVLSAGVIVMLGVKPGSRSATGYDVFPFDQVVKIEPRGAKPTRRRKAS
jgi:hypothetical protein